MTIYDMGICDSQGLRFTATPELERNIIRAGLSLITPTDHLIKSGSNSFSLVSRPFQSLQAVVSVPSFASTIRLKWEVLSRYGAAVRLLNVGTSMCMQELPHERW